jgi:hypothetical protein
METKRCPLCGGEMTREWKTQTMYVWLCGNCGEPSLPVFPSRLDEHAAGAALPGCGIPGVGVGR